VRSYSIVLCLTALTACSTSVDEEHTRATPKLEIEDTADLRPQARAILRALRTGGWRAALALHPYASVTVPTTIRVWRKSLGGTASCAGQVDVLPLEQYVKGVLPHEWIVSWEPASLRAGALAIRTYASSWVIKGGKYDCADVCDTTSSQVYKDQTDPKANQAVDATAGVFIVKNDQLVFAEYSAENGDPTKDGVSDPPCAGKALFGHGRGMCQWGSQRWALQGQSHEWIATHYYPGATLYSSTGPQDGPSSDSGPPPDGPAPDGTAPDGSSSDAPAPTDAPITPSDSRRYTEAGLPIGYLPNMAGETSGFSLEGGWCSISGRPEEAGAVQLARAAGAEGNSSRGLAVPPPAILALLVLALFRRRRA